MQTRLTLWFGLLVLALLGALAVAITANVEPGESRDRLLLFVGLAALAGAAVVATLGAVLARQVRRPFRELVEAVGRVGEVGAGPRLVSTGDSEQVALAEAFNDASERLTSRIARLEEDRQQLRTVLSGMVEGV